MPNGVGTNFGVGRRGETRSAESGGGVFGEGQPAPSHQLGGLWERCKLPASGVRAEPGRRRVFLYYMPSDYLSIIQFARLGIRFF